MPFAMPARPRAPHMVQTVVRPAYISYQELTSVTALLDTRIASERRPGSTAK